MSDHVELGRRFSSTRKYDQTEDEFHYNLATATSAFAVRERMVLGVSFRRAFFGDNETVVGLFAERRTGQPYTFVYSNGGLFGDPIGRTRAPIYVPTGPGDTIVSEVGDIDGNGTANESGDWDALMSGLSGLGAGIQSRNAQREPSISRVDLRLSQEFPVLRTDHKITVILDIQNFANLLNDEWGVPEH